MTRLVKIVLAATLAGLPLSACSEGRFRSGESTYCSIDSGDSNFYECDHSRRNLVCIQTYSQGTKMQPVSLCRYTCQTRSDCANSGDVCCTGPIVRETFGATKACVPRDLCQTDPAALLEPAPMSKADGGIRDSGPMSQDANQDVALPMSMPLDDASTTSFGDAGSDI